MNFDLDQLAEEARARLSDIIAADVAEAYVITLCNAYALRAKLGLHKVKGTISFREALIQNGHHVSIDLRRMVGDDVLLVPAPGGDPQFKIRHTHQNQDLGEWWICGNRYL